MPDWPTVGRISQIGQWLYGFHFAIRWPRRIQPMRRREKKKKKKWRRADDGGRWRNNGRTVTLTAYFDTPLGYIFGANENEKQIHRTNPLMANNAYTHTMQTQSKQSCMVTAMLFHRILSYISLMTLDSNKQQLPAQHHSTKTRCATRRGRE